MHSFWNINLINSIFHNIRTKRGKVDLSPKMLGMDWHIILYNACHVYVASYHFIIQAHQQARLSCDQFWYLCVYMYICKTFVTYQTKLPQIIARDFFSKNYYIFSSVFQIPSFWKAVELQLQHKHNIRHLSLKLP